MADYWSDYTDGILAEVEKRLGDKYDFTVREFLQDPDKFSKRSNIDVTVSNMREDTEKILDDMLEDMGPALKQARDDAAKADSITSQLSQNMSNLAKQNKVPIIRPTIYDRNEARDETIYVNSIDSGVLDLARKLMESANFVADNTYTYNTYKIGHWIFPIGSRNYAIRVYVAPNEAMYLEGSKLEIQTLFDAAEDLLKS